jgi:filamentous hemagglutinin
MNKKLYRLVFNARRGQMMAVAETAGAQGKSASGETTANTNTNSASNVPPAQQGCAQAAIKVIAVSMLNLARLAPVSAQAQVRADAITPGNQ